MKKFISIGLTAVMIISALVVLDIVPVMNVSAVGEPYDLWDGILGNGIWGTDGDWTITFSSQTYTFPTVNTIVVNGNLTIQQGGSLTLQGVTLKMATPTNGTYWIRVENTTNPIFRPQLIIENESITPSIITSNITDGQHRFGFVVEAPTPTNPVGPLFTMRNSELHECGWHLTDSINYKDGGLWIGNENAIIQNNLITDCYNGIVIHNAFDPTITQNIIQDCEYAGIHVWETIATSFLPVKIGPGNIITNNSLWGISVDNSWWIDIHNNTINSNGKNNIGGGVNVASLSRDIYIQHNIIEANEQYSLWVADSFDISVYKNSLNGSLLTNLTYFDTVAGLDMRYNSICQGGSSSLNAYLIGRAITDARLDNNHISDNIGIGALFSMCQIDVTNNVIENNPGGGLCLQMGSGESVIDSNTFRNNDDMGLFLVASNIDVRNNVFEGNGDGTPYANDPLLQDSGMSILNSNDIRVYNNQFIQNVRTTGPDEVDGIYLLTSDGINMWNNTLDQNDYNLHCRGGSTAWDTNSTYILSSTPTPTPHDVYIEDAYLEDGEPSSYGPNHITFLNTTFDNSSTYIADSISGDHTVMWYKHILVEDYYGNPVSGASVYVNDTFSNPEPLSGQPFTTDAQGRVSFIPLTEYVEDYSSRTSHTPHNIDVYEGGREAHEIATMTSSHLNTLVLNEKPIVVRLEPVGGAVQDVNRTNTIIIEVEFDDQEDTEEQLFEVYFEFRVNDTAPWINETSPYFGTKTAVGTGETTVWQIEFTPPPSAPLGLYDFKVRCEDLYPTSSDWLNSSNSVNVLNNDPTAEDILVITAPPEVYRGETIDIYGDADDIEDGDEDSTWDAELEYRLNGSSFWETVYITVSEYNSSSGNWKFEFSPPASSPDPQHGPVDFRIKFQDPDGNWSDWYYENDLVDILNNPPQFVDLDKGQDSVYRGNMVRVYANLSDAEEFEQDLYVHFYYYDGTNWVDDWLNTPNIQNYGQGEWDPVQQRFFVEFSPLPTANIGDYQFRLYISDSDGGYLTYAPMDNIVNVINNPPIALYPVSVSAPYVTPGGGYIYIYVNADDAENAEDQLTLRVQQRHNDTAFPPEVWYDAYIFTESYEGIPNTGRLRANFTPLTGIQLGDYDFRAWVEDQDGDKSNYVYLYNAVEVLSPEPTIESVDLQTTEVFRGETVYIFLEASDMSDWESELTIEVQYKQPGNGSFENIPSSDLNIRYEDTDSNPENDVGYWIIEYTPENDEDTETGTYEFHVRVQNTALGWSNGGAWTSVTGSVEVKNKRPTASNLRVEDNNTVERGDTIYMWADVNDDDETALGDFIPHFEYRGEGGDWEDEYLINIRPPTGGSNSWRITFSPPEEEDFTIGLYDFRVWFTDDEENSNILTVDDMVEVINVKPTADTLNIPSREGYRLEYIIITATGTDSDGNIAANPPTFQYKGPTGDWVNVEDSGSYFQDTPTYMSGKWHITFNPTANAELGKYSFRVKFSDGIDESDWMNKDNYYELMNNEPEVEITSPLPGMQSSDEVSFTATAVDYEDSTLTWEWNFGDGSISTEESPTHTYEEAGYYIVTVKVIDGDGDDAVHSINITIEEAEEEPTELDMDTVPFLWLLLLIVLILLLILIILIMLTKRKITPYYAPPEPTEAVEKTPPAPEEVPEPPLEEEGQDEIPPSIESSETPLSEPEEEIEKQ